MRLQQWSIGAVEHPVDLTSDPRQRETAGFLLLPATCSESFSRSPYHRAPNSNTGLGMSLTLPQNMTLEVILLKQNDGIARRSTVFCLFLFETGIASSKLNSVSDNCTTVKPQDRSGHRQLFSATAFKP